MADEKSVKIDAGCEEDLDVVIGVDQATFEESDWWNIDLWIGFLRNHVGCRILLAKTFISSAEESVVGFAAFDKNGKLMKLAVLPSWQRQGIGSLLLDEVLTVSRTEFKKYCLGIQLNVDPNNTAAVTLYQRYDFTKDCVVKDYYGNGRDAWRMMKDLTAS